MKRLLSFLGRFMGLHFAPDNHVVPVLRLEQYHRAQGPGFFWIMPLLERTLPAVKTSLYVGPFFFEEVLSKDNIPFSVQLTVLFTFDPNAALKSAAAVLVRGDPNLLPGIVRDYTSQGLRRLASRYHAEILGNAATMSTIERDLARSLKAEMYALGIAPLPKGGILIKETVPPVEFKRTMLDVKHDEAILEVLRNYPVPELVQLLNQVIFANSLKEHTGELALIMGSPEDINKLPLMGRNKVYGQNGARP